MHAYHHQQQIQLQQQHQQAALLYFQATASGPAFYCSPSSPYHACTQEQQSAQAAMLHPSEQLQMQPLQPALSTMLDNPYSFYQSAASHSSPYLTQHPQFVVPAGEAPSLVIATTPHSPMSRLPSPASDVGGPHNAVRTASMPDAAFAHAGARIGGLDINDTGDNDSHDPDENGQKNEDIVMAGRRNTSGATDPKTKILKSKVKDVKPRRRVSAKAASVADLKVEQTAGYREAKVTSGAASSAHNVREDVTMTVDDPKKLERLGRPAPNAVARADAWQSPTSSSDPRDCSSAAEALLNLRRH
jgi:hypothetical protein